MIEKAFRTNLEMKSETAPPLPGRVSGPVPSGPVPGGQCGGWKPPPPLGKCGFKFCSLFL